MAAKAYRALEPISRGRHPDVPAGEIVIEGELLALGDNGVEVPIKFARLIQLGIVEPVSAPRGAEKAAEAPSDAPAKPAAPKRAKRPTKAAQ